jgi:hypothetical protein
MIRPFALYLASRSWTELVRRILLPWGGAHGGGVACELSAWVLDKADIVCMYEVKEL